VRAADLAPLITKVPFGLENPQMKACFAGEIYLELTPMAPYEKQ
jgi:hypothetical protein